MCLGRQPTEQVRSLGLADRTLRGSYESRPSTNRASTITARADRVDHAAPCLGRQPTEQVRSPHLAARARRRGRGLGRQPTEQVRSRRGLRVRRTSARVWSRPSTNRASTITCRRSSARARRGRVSAVNQPSKYDHGDRAWQPAIRPSRLGRQPTEQVRSRSVLSAATECMHGSRPSTNRASTITRARIRRNDARTKSRPSTNRASTIT